MMRMKMRRPIAILLIFLLLGLQWHPFSRGFAEERIEPKGSSLAEITILQDVNLRAYVFPSESKHYGLYLTMSSDKLAELGLLGADKRAVFYIPELAGSMTVNQVKVRAEILPITMDDLPMLNSLVSNLTGSVTNLTSELVGLLDGVIGIIPSGIVSIEGLDELSNALDNLNNLDAALSNLLAYEEHVPAVAQEDGTIIVDFNEGLGSHLETAISGLVIQLVTDVLDAVNGLEINLLKDIPLVGSLLNGIINGLIKPLLDGVVSTANAVLNGLDHALVGLTDELAALQLIGETTIIVDTFFEKPDHVEGEIDIYGAIISNQSLINIEVLSNKSDHTTIWLGDDDKIEFGLEFKNNPIKINVKETMHKELNGDSNSEIIVTPLSGEDSDDLPELADLELIWEVVDGTEVVEFINQASGKLEAKGVGPAIIKVTATDEDGQLRVATAKVLVNLQDMYFPQSLYLYSEDNKNMFDKLMIKPEGFNKTEEVFEWSVKGEDSEDDIALTVDQMGEIQQSGDKCGFAILNVRLKDEYNEIDGDIDDDFDQAKTLIKVNPDGDSIPGSGNEW